MTVDMFSRWRVLVSFSFFLAGTAIAVASFAPHRRLPDGPGFNLVLHGAAYGTLVILGGMLRRQLRWVAVATLVYRPCWRACSILCRGAKSISLIWPRT